MISAKWSIFVCPGAHRTGSPPAARTQTPPPTAFLMLSKLHPKTFPALIVEIGRWRRRGRVHKAEFSLRHSPWQHVPSSRDCWSPALISQRAARHCEGAKHLLPTYRPKIHDWKSAFRHFWPLITDLGVEREGRSFFFHTWALGRQKAERTDVVAVSHSSTPAEAIQPSGKPVRGGVPPLPLTHNAKFFCNFVPFCHIKLHRGEVNCYRGVEIIAITGRKKVTGHVTLQRLLICAKRGGLINETATGSGSHWRARFPLLVVGLLALLSEVEQLYQKTLLFYSGGSHVFTAFFWRFIGPKSF